MNHMIDSTSAPYCFISYCRQEVTFADSFSRELEKRGFRTWVDFRNLVPGHEWQQQLDDAVKDAATILLVVSKASMSSLPVKDEWTKSLAKGKRIILILFEPCKLDPGLTGLAWVDFTKPFDKAMSKLIGLLARSTQPAPSTLLQKWMHVPSSVMVFAFLSLLLVLLCAISIPLAIYSGFQLWTGTVVSTSSLTYRLYSTIRFLTLFFIWLPTLLNFAWLPIQLFRRTHNAQKIRNTLNALFYSGLLLITLPVILYFQAIIEDLPTSAFFNDFLPIIAVNLITIVVCLYLNRLLVSNEMYRWSGPNGVLIQSRPPDLTGHIDNGAHMRVAVEYAPQDRLYAQELKASIRKAGHFYTDHVHSADVILCLLSVYKTGSDFDPETKRVIPTLMQVCQVDQHLSRVQWIDLRHGKVSMDAVAHLLDEPAELLRILGVLPVRTIILPNAVKWLSILITFSLTAGLVWTAAVGAVGVAAFRFINNTGIAPEGFRPDIDMGALILLVVPFLGLYFLRRYIVNRKLRYFPFKSYWWTVGFAILIALLAMSTAGFIQLGWPFLLIPLLMLHKDVRLWLPVRAKKRVRDTQRSEVQPATPQ